MLTFIQDNPSVLIAFLGAIPFVINAVFSLVLNIGKVKELKMDTAINAIKIGVQASYDIYVKEIKKFAEDGKLEQYEKEQARNIALAHARDLCYAQGVDIMKMLGRPAIDALINLAVGKAKADSMVGKLLAPYATTALSETSTSEAPELQ